MSTARDGAQHKILVFDIETAPFLAYIWHPAEKYTQPERVQRETFMLSWAAKWYGQKQMFCDVLTSTEAKQQDDSRIVRRLAELINEADIVVAHNGDRFDMKMLNNRLLLLGHDPIEPVRTIDTCKEAKKKFRLASNSLNYLARMLDVGKKVKTDWELWQQCYVGDTSALDKMKKYNKHDVTLLEAVFDRLKPYIKGLPRMVDAKSEMQRACPLCGRGDVLEKRGFYRTNASTFQRYKCNNCGRWARSRRSLKQKKLGTVPITTR